MLKGVHPYILQKQNQRNFVWTSKVCFLYHPKWPELQKIFSWRLDKVKRDANIKWIFWNQFDGNHTSHSHKDFLGVRYCFGALGIQTPSENAMTCHDIVITLWSDVLSRQNVYFCTINNFKNIKETHYCQSMSKQTSYQPKKKKTAPVSHGVGNDGYRKTLFKNHLKI